MRSALKNARLIGVLLIVFHPVSALAQRQRFKVVIDAGHGGKDPGCSGTGRYKKTEKDIALRVALKLGDLIEKNTSDVAVIYTRKSDRFVTLRDRSRMANREKASLFLSIHCNSAKSRESHGVEAYVMGLDKTGSNFEIAQRENSVIYLEGDYQKAYGGFDPSSPESYIGLTLVENQNLAQSIKFADYIQEAVQRVGRRSSRGVKQAGFWVISKNIMPSVLVELGFLTNGVEERYLNTESGQAEVARALYDAFKKYKGEIDDFEAASRKARASYNRTHKAASKGILYGVQLYAIRKPVSVHDKIFKGLYPIRTDRNGPYTRYTYGAVKTIQQAYALLDKVRQKGFKKAFLVAYKGGKRYRAYYDNAMPSSAGRKAGKKKSKRRSVVFKVQFYASPVLLQAEKRFQGVREVSHYKYRGWYRYSSGSFSRYESAVNRLHELQKKGYKDAFLIAFRGGKRISLTLARALTQNR